MRDQESLMLTRCNPGSNERTVLVDHIQTILAHERYDRILKRDIRAPKDLDDPGFAHFVFTLGIEVDFVNRPTTRKNLNMHRRFPFHMP